MTLNGLIITVCIIVIVILLYKSNNVAKKRDSRVSFKESMDLVGLPIVTFISGDKKLNFLLDTGSDNSYINSSLISEIKAEMTGEKSSTIGASGEGLATIYYNVTLGYREQMFTEKLGAMDLSAAFNALKESYGVQIHGILGSRFFEKYRYILDFKDLSAYRK